MIFHLCWCQWASVSDLPSKALRSQVNLLETGTDSQTWRTDLESSKGWGWKRGGVGIWNYQIERLYTEWINNEVLLRRQENYIQYPIIKHNGKECENG